MIVLGIETSCDETSAAVVEDGRKILSNVVLSQEKLHRPFKGIVPEIASRAHLENINFVIEKALKKVQSPKSEVRSPKSKIQGKGRFSINYGPSTMDYGRSEVDAIAVTEGPGLVGSLLVGKMTAEALSWLWNKPLVGINHLESHLFSSLLIDHNLFPPFLGLIVSGGHTELVLVNDFGRYEVLGRTRDDAAGECFDKVAKILNLGYPGGPLIDKIAKKGNAKAIHFSRPYLHGSWDFSFSGLKTAVLYFWNKVESQNSKKNMKEKTFNLSVADVCASVQATIMDVLVGKTFKAAKKYGMKKIVVGGGVSANSALRKGFLGEGKKNGLKVFLPSKELCTDNAAMVAAAGYYKLQRRYQVMGCGSWVKSQKLTTHNSQLTTAVEVDPSLAVENW